MLGFKKTKRVQESDGHNRKRLAVAEMACMQRFGVEVEGEKPHGRCRGDLWDPGVWRIMHHALEEQELGVGGGEGRQAIALRITWPDDSFQQGDSPSQELQLGLLF